MITFKKYFEILEEIRIEKKISVDDLCENIISTRSYFRYLNSTSPIRMDIFSKLMNRLKLDLTNIVLYGVHFKGDSAGDYRFVFRTHFKSYHDIIPIYHKALKTSQAHPKDIVLKSFILKYEYEIGTLTKEVYIKEITALIHQMSPRQTKTVDALCIYLSLLEVKPNNQLITLSQVMDLFETLDIRMNAMYYFTSLERILFLMMGNKDISIETYSNFLKEAESACKYFPIADTLINQALFNAYKHELLNQESECENMLYQYCMYAVSIYGNERMKHVINLLKKNFDMNFHSFITEKTQRKINQSFINLI